MKTDPLSLTKPLGREVVGRHFLFLQGMQSAFFRKVGEHLAAADCRVTRINLCLGDWLFWHGPETINYRDTLRNWPAYIERFMDDEQVTCLVILGEQRKYHDDAIKIAQRLDIDVVATDFGYLRPDWIAIERDGMNGNSRLPKDIDFYRKRNDNLPQMDLASKYSDSEFNTIRNDMVYTASNLLDFFKFPHYQQSDRRPHPLQAHFFSMLKWLRLLRDYRKTRSFVRTLLDKGQTYYVYAMQLEHDFQIVAYSDYDDLVTPLRQVIHSFAQFAPAKSLLVVKNHPCDFGIRRWQNIVSGVALTYGVSDRVRFLDGGTPLSLFLENCRGLVTVNSTSGLGALIVGCPVIALSDAVYNMPGLTFTGTLDNFWNESKAAKPENVNAFVNTIAHSAHVRGVFFNEPGLSEGANAFAQRLLDGRIAALS